MIMTYRVRRTHSTAFLLWLTVVFVVALGTAATQRGGASTDTMSTWKTSRNDGTSFGHPAFSDRRSHIFVDAGTRTRRSGTSSEVSLYTVLSNTSIWDATVDGPAHIGTAGGASELAVATTMYDCTGCRKLGAKVNQSSCVVLSVWDSSGSKTPTFTALAPLLTSLIGDNVNDDDTVAVSSDGKRVVVTGFWCETYAQSSPGGCQSTSSKPYPVCLSVDVFSTSSKSVISTVPVQCDLNTLTSVYGVTSNPDASRIALSFAFEGQHGGMMQDTFRLAVVDVASSTVAFTDMCVGYCDVAGSDVSPNGQYVSVTQVSMYYDVHVYQYASDSDSGTSSLTEIGTVHVNDAAGVNGLLWLLGNGDVLACTGTDSTMGFIRVSPSSGSTVYSRTPIPFGLGMACVSMSLDRRYALVMYCNQQLMSPPKPLWVWDVEGGSVMWSFDFKVPGFTPKTGDISTDGKKVSIAVVGSWPGAYTERNSMAYISADLS